jgi:hypothetical protein
VRQVVLHVRASGSKVPCGRLNFAAFCIVGFHRENHVKRTFSGHDISPSVKGSEIQKNWSDLSKILVFLEKSTSYPLHSAYGPSEAVSKPPQQKRGKSRSLRQQGE